MIYNNILKVILKKSATLFAALLCTLSVKVSAQLTVAFTGDQGVNENSRAVLRLIADEGTDLLLIQGDLGYGARASAQWIENINDILGEDFPVLLTVGNHENYEWPIYRDWMVRRIRDVPELVCQGNPGVKAHCSFQGLSVVQVAPGVNEVRGVAARDDYAAYLDSELSNTANIWRICSWHKNQRQMQVGSKLDETGWDVYSTCLKHGSMVATAHEHSYSRTFLMNDFENQQMVHRNAQMQIGPGKSFAFVSGLGGIGIRRQRISGDWWASVYATDQNAIYGALFCTFEDKRAACQFKNIDGVVIDSFTLENQNTPGALKIIDQISDTGATRSTIKAGPLPWAVALLSLIAGFVWVIWQSKRRG